MARLVGEALLAGFIQKLVDFITCPELWKYALKGKVDPDELKKWGRMLVKIHAVLHDAEEKQMTNRLVKMWLDDLRDLAYDLDDILDDFATEALRSRINAAQPQSGALGTFFSFDPSVFASNSSMNSKIEEMAARLQDIVAQKDDLNLREIDSGWCGGKRKRAAEMLPTTSLVVASRVYGREADKVGTVEWLLKDDTADGELSVIAIVGMAGMGKTTLAQLAFNDNQVNAHFDLRVWVCVSDYFDVFAITKTILQSVDPNSRDVKDLNNLQVMLKEEFSGKKFLLVLDDVWNENSRSWDTLCLPMRAGAPGSKMIVTTRNEGVAAVVRTCPSHPLRQLSDDDCMAIFTQVALGRTNFEGHPELEAVGKEIVRRCRGLPLAATVLGGMLRNRTSHDEWAYILQSKIWDLSEHKNDILPALWLSYLHLPSHLKPCFAYCSIFPKGYEFDKDELVLLWMAEGFLQQTKEETIPEDLGSKYFDDLLSRSFFQPSSWGSSKFVMHDLTHDLAQFAAGKMYFHLDSVRENNKGSTISKKARHASFNRQRFEMRSKFEPFIEAKCLRTLVALPIKPSKPFNYISIEVLDELLKEVKYLRVLSLGGYRLNELPNSIANLKHLRYLNLSWCSIRSLPDSMGLLYNLQSLILSHCWQLTMLPMGIGSLVNLRHLDISHTSRLQELPSQIGNLTNLQMLSKFIVNQGSSLGIRELKNLSYLQGKLDILGLNNVLNIGDARDANMERKHRIEELKMQWNDDIGATRNEMQERLVSEQLKPHKDLKKLEVVGYGGSEFPGWIRDPSFPIMTHLILKDCWRCTSLPALGRLSSLKVLHIEGMSEVKSIAKEFYGGIEHPFPCLELLKFKDMPKWEDWDCPDALKEVALFPSLRQLTIEDNGNLQELLNGLHTLTCLEELEINTCPKLESFPDTGLPRMLRRLKVSRCEGLKLLPLEYTSSALEELDLERCPKLESFPDTGLPSMLKRLKVSRCEGLKSLPHNYASSALESLVIKHCPSLRCFPSSELPPTLKTICIEVCDKLESLPEEMMRYKSTSLEVLRISRCCSLSSFPRGELPSTLKQLEIDGCSNLESMSRSMFVNNIVLDYLDLSDYPNLRTLPECLHFLNELHITDCPGLECFPAGGMSNLTTLCISLCHNLKFLPHQMRDLTSLQHLRLSSCPKVKSFPGKALAPNLTLLEIERCENLESLPHEMRNLNSLKISLCPSLESFPEVGLAPNLTSLEISNCENLKSLLHEMRNLKSLKISQCSSLKFFPEVGFAPNLASLEIEDCESLKSLPNEMNYLKSLKISLCPSLEFFPEVGLAPNLTSLEINCCENLKTPICKWGLHTSLSELTIKDTFSDTDIVSLSAEECLLPVSLTSLTIGGMQSLAFLSLQSLFSLQYLQISFCPNLHSLALPLGTLVRLEITRCPTIKERCLRDTGDYWPNIAHIPFIQLDWEWIH